MYEPYHTAENQHERSKNTFDKFMSDWRQKQERLAGREQYCSECNQSNCDCAINRASVRRLK